MNSIRVLLIEDDPDQRLLYQTKFTLEGHTILLAENAEAGLAIAGRDKPDVILLDVLIYDMNGVEVLKQLKKEESTRDIPVFMLTNLAKKEVQQEALAAGAADYLVKTDIEPAELVRRVVALAEQSEQSEQNE
jgi:DNA-binding response OmpR family regulator